MKKQHGIEQQRTTIKTQQRVVLKDQFRVIRFTHPTLFFFVLLVGIGNGCLKDFEKLSGKAVVVGSSGC
jgi:hypothetical protein